MKVFSPVFHFGASAIGEALAISSRYYDALHSSAMGLEAKANLEHLAASFAFSSAATSLSGSRLVIGSEENTKRTSSMAWDFASMYLGCHLVYELSSASKKGFFQWDQVACDWLGYSIPMIYLAVTKRLRKPSPLYSLRDNIKKEKTEEEK